MDTIYHVALLDYTNKTVKVSYWKLDSICEPRQREYLVHIRDTLALRLRIQPQLPLGASGASHPSMISEFRKLYASRFY